MATILDFDDLTFTVIVSNYGYKAELGDLFQSILDFERDYKIDANHPYRVEHFAPLASMLATVLVPEEGAPPLRLKTSHAMLIRARVLSDWAAIERRHLPAGSAGPSVPRRQPVGDDQDGTDAPGQPTQPA